MSLVKPPSRVMLCLEEGCYGEFYLPLDEGEEAACPNDLDHTVAVYVGDWVVRGVKREAAS